MPFEHKILDYWTWLLGDPATSSLWNPQTWGFMAGTVAILLMLLLVVPFVWFLFAAIKMGPSEAFYLVARTVYYAFADDLPRFSARRTFAIAKLSIVEAVRNRVLIVAFGVFVLLMLFAGLFLDVGSSNPARSYLSFVLNTTNFLVIILALAISTFSLPADIRNKTIYTVVTKPVRSSEVVLGRILGFAAIGTLMVASMGVVSYFFVVRGLAHSHVVEAGALVELPPGADGETGGVRGETSLDMHHRHKFEIGKDGKARTDTVMGHYHDVEMEGAGVNAKVTVGPPREMLVARAPRFGKLQVLDRSGKAAAKGINVGNEWEYRGYIEGGNSKAAAIWTFTDITPERYPNGLPLELNLRVFRSYKGNIERGVLGELVLRNPNPAAKVKASGPIIFESKEFQSDYKFIDRSLYGESGGSGSDNKIDLFDDLVDNGKIEVVIRCAEPSQYFGMAEPDVYLRPADASFALNFAKAYLSIWLQMLLVTCFGVMFSTFLSWPVAVMATVSVVVLGFFSQFARDVTTGAMVGGGPVESFIRMLTQANVSTDLELPTILGIDVFGKLIYGIDMFIMGLMYGATFLLPNLGDFDSSRFVAGGYNIYGDIVAQQLTTGLVFFVVVTVVGYFFLKTREIAA